MSRPLWRMAGGSMSIEMDEAEGRQVGSKVKLSGRILDLELSLTEQVTERRPPSRKTWEKVGSPHLLVIGSYRMGFELTSQSRACLARIFIDYELPQKGLSHLLGRLFGAYYARWCTETMVCDVVRHF